MGEGERAGVGREREEGRISHSPFTLLDMGNS